MRGVISFVFLASLAATTAAGGEAVDRICAPDDLPTATQPRAELSRVFAPAAMRDVAPPDLPPGAMEVVVARINADGKVELSCVDTEARARAFFAERRAKQKHEAQEK